MGLTGVIYAAIVVAWAAYLVPLALRRHDEVARSRSIERFSSAMRVLARRGSSTGGRVVVTPPRRADRLVSPHLGKAESPEAVAQAPRPSKAALRAAAARRRRVLVVLLCLAAATGGVSGFGVIPWWSFAIPVGVIVAFLLLARRQVRRASDVYWSDAATVAPESSNVVRRAPARVDASHGASKEPDPDDEPTVTLTPEEMAAAAEAELAEQRVLAVSVPTADGGSLWDPLPVTLPTYVDKPAARRSFRTIDLGEPGTWSSGHSDADTQTAAAAREEERTEGAIDEPRAANG